MIQQVLTQFSDMLYYFYQFVIIEFLETGLVKIMYVAKLILYEERLHFMEKVIHIISGGLHILAAITWIGSMIYNQFAVAPALNTSLGSTKAHAVGGLIMKNFSPLTWISLIILIATGIFATVSKSDKFTSWTSGPGSVLTDKLALVGVLVIILLMQTFVYGPRMKQLIAPSTTKSTKNEAENLPFML